MANLGAGGSLISTDGVLFQSPLADVCVELSRLQADIGTNIHPVAVLYCSL